MTRRIAAIVGLLAAFGATAAVAAALWVDRDADRGRAEAEGSGGSRVELPTVTSPLDAPPAREAAAGPYAVAPAPEPLPVEVRLKRKPAAGLLFDVDSGEVLWQRRPLLELPIASLTKMMTALLVAGQGAPKDRVVISAKAAHTPGSATGILPAGRRVPFEPLLEALIMISANDAAVALAEAEAGSTTAFVDRMNQRAAVMGLECTRFSTPNGLKDRGNHSCAADLAALARADLANPRIARIARTTYARPRFPVKGHRLHLANNHYFLGRGLAGVPGARVTGLKTGWTDGAGRCYVTTAELRGRHLGVVLLDSPDPIRQVPLLLRAGFVELGVLAPTSPRAKAGSP